MLVHMLLEGRHEEAMARALIRYCGHRPGAVYGGKGCAYIRKHAVQFLRLATAEQAVLVLTDFMDSGCACPPTAYKRYILDHVQHVQEVPPTFLCRFAVNELESWLMADREGMARFLSISVKRIPRKPETLADPKKTLVKLADASRSTRIRYAMVPPRHRHGGVVGPGYTELVAEFIKQRWSPERAMRNAPSLARCVRRLLELPAL